VSAHSLPISVPTPVTSGAVLPTWLVVGFTGHRHLHDAGIVHKAIVQALDGLAARAPNLAGVSSAAVGGDTLFAEEMLRRERPIRVVLPFPVLRFEEDFAGDPDAWARSLAIIRAAAALEVVPPSQGEKDPATAAYMEAGVRTVDHCHVLIAVWDGQPVQGPGGTADVVAYADAIGRPVILIDPASGGMTERRLDRLPSRAETPAAGGTGPDQPRALVEAYYDAVNRQAERDAPVARGLMRSCVWLHLSASSLAGGALIFGAEGAAALAVGVTETILLALAFTLLWVRGRRHRAWRRLRAEAEACRSALATWEIRRHEAAGLALRVPQPGLEGLWATLDLLRQLDRAAGPSLEEAREAYAEHRVRDQIDYFTRKYRVAHRQVRRRKILMTTFTALGITAAVASVPFVLLGPVRPLLVHWRELVAIMAPLAASALGLLLITDESARRDDRYAEMVATLQDLLLRVRAAPTWESLNRATMVVEEELSQELLEWRAFVRHTEHMH
jgi:hypothetical protein